MEAVSPLRRASTMRNLRTDWSRELPLSQIFAGLEDGVVEVAPGCEGVRPAMDPVVERRLPLLLACRLDMETEGAALESLFIDGGPAWLEVEAFSSEGSLDRRRRDKAACDLERLCELVEEARTMLATLYDSRHVWGDKDLESG